MISPSEPRARTDFFAAPLEGIRRGTNRATAAANSLAGGEIDAEQIVELMLAQKVVKANAAYVRTADDLLGTLLNTQA